jgi:hypothetical protein
MQGLNTGTGRLAKKLKLADNKYLTDTLPTNKPFKKPNNSAYETPTETPSEHPSETPTNASTTSIPATSEYIINKLSADCLDITKVLDSSGINDLLISVTYIYIKGNKIIENMSLTTYRARYNIINNFFG